MKLREYLLETDDLKFYDNDSRKLLTEEEVRKLAFRVNIDDLDGNFNDIFIGIIDVKDVTKHITDSLYADIKDVVKDLNECWGFNIDILKKID